MSNKPGWISLHRKILDNEQFRDPDALALWMHLLLRANYQETIAKVGNQAIKVRRGQLICGRKSLSLSSGVQESKIERLLKRWENEQQIEQQAFTKFRLITITSYDKYQSHEQRNDEKMNTPEQGNNNNIFIKPTKEQVFDYFHEKGLTIAECDLEAHKFYSYYESCGWKVGKKKEMKDWKSAVNNWMRNRNAKPRNPKPSNTKQNDTSWIDKLETTNSTIN
jgi:hypothetical protein